MKQYTSLYEANKRIAELEESLSRSLETSEARRRLLADAEEERNLLRLQSSGRGEMVEALTVELGRARDLVRDAMRELVTIMWLAGVGLPEKIAADVKAAGLDV